MRGRVACPICRTECDWEGNPFRPFCSERCRLIDLGNWMGERYRIPGAPAGDESAGTDDNDSDDKE